jgi:hypothetical protein
MLNEMIPKAVADKLGVSSAHMLAYFDDRDNLLASQLYYDRTGVQVRPAVSEMLVQQAVELKNAGVAVW